ncbi:tetratricopeptide repeat protein [Aeromonas veronii]
MKKRIGISFGVLLMSWVGICQADDALERARQLIAEGKERDNIVQLREAVSLLQAGVKSGDPASQLELGKLYSDGRYDTRNGQEALSLITAAAEQGNAEAQLLLGRMYSGVQEGIIEVKGDREAGFEWYQKSAALGNSDAQYSLGLIYASEYEPIHDNKVSLKWYTKSAEQGNPLSQEVLGRVYLYGELDQKPDLDKAEKYLKLADSHRTQDLVGQFNALRCLRGADENGDLKALGELCRNEDADRGIQLWVGLRCQDVDLESTQSIDACFNKQKPNDPETNFMHAFVFAFGYGRPVDLAEAYAYFAMAAAVPSSELEVITSYKQAIEKAISPAKLSEAKKRFNDMHKLAM